MISTVTVNYKTVDYVEKMLSSLFKFHQGRDIEVFVVENGSGDDLSELESQFPQVNFIYSKENLGFAGGCNVAIKKAKGDYVLLLNPDVIFDDDAIYQMEDVMNVNPEVGIGGISLKNLDGSQQKCVWRFPLPKDQFVLLLKLNHIFKNLASTKRWRYDDFNYERTQDVDQVMGAFFCIRSDVLAAIGMIDDGYFMWYEEVDYCKQATDIGWKVRYFSDISARHKLGASFDQVHTLWKQKILRASIIRYIGKHHGSAVASIFCFYTPLFFVLGYVASVIKPK